MANVKISELNPLVTVQDADVLPIVDNAITKKVTAAILRSYTQGNSVLLTGAQTIAGIKTFTAQLASTIATGTAPFSVASTTKVTNLNADLLDGLSSADFQATLSGTGIVKSTAGTISYLTDNSSNWNTAFNDSITSAAVTGTTTKTLTLNQQDGGSVTASWTDDNTDAVSSVFGRTGAVVATEGDYSLTQLSDVTLTSPANGQVLKYNGTAWINGTDLNSGTVTSVGMSVPTGLSVAGSPITTSGTLALSMAAGYSLPTDASQSTWNTAYNERISSASAPLAISSNALSISQATASVNGYLSSTDWTTFNAKQAAGNYITALTGEASASGPGSSSITLTNSAVIGKVLTGLNVTGGSVSATDSILDAFGKVQNQINSLVGGTIYKGTWDASTNTPTLVSSVGTQGFYYIVSVAGATNLNGITSWNVGDWAIFDGTAWQKVDNTDSVVSVNGLTGAVSLTTSNITEGTNLYFTDARARAAISLTTTGTSGVATYVSGVLNIPNYGSALSAYVPYTGATTNVNLGVHSLTASDLVINHASGSGVAASITKGGNGEALTVVKSSGSGNAASITGGTTLISELNLTTDLADAYIASAATWNAKQNAITLTTTGTSGAATLVGSTLNIPNYADTDTGITSLNGLTALTQTFAVGTSGTDFGISSATSTHTFNLPTASATNRGALSSTDWTTFNNKQNALTNPITGTGTTNYLPKFTGASALGNSLIYDSGTAIGIETTTPTALLQVKGVSPVTPGARYLKTQIGGGNSWGLESFEELAVGFNGIRSIFSGGDNWDISFSAGTSTNWSSGTQPERMRITATGNVGIATLRTPGEKLQVQGNIRLTGADIITANTLISEINSYAGSTNQFKTASIKLYTGSFVDQGFMTFNTSISAADVERMRIAESGNVGINTTAPTSKLQVVGLVDYATNALAIAGGLTVGAFYHTAGVLKVVI